MVGEVLENNTKNVGRIDIFKTFICPIIEMGKFDQCSKVSVTLSTRGL